MKCVVFNCKNRRNDKDLKKTFFGFPKEKRQLEKWLKFCKNNNTFKPKTWRICMDHFNEEDISGNGMYQEGYATKRTLKPGALPCRYNVTTYSDQKRHDRCERRGNKKIVEALLMEPRHTEKMEAEDVEIQSPSNESEIELENVEIQAPSNEEIIWEQEQCQEDTIKLLHMEINLLKKENKNLKDELWRAKRKSEYEIRMLKKKVSKSEFHRKNFEEKLSGIFTDGQINKIKNDIKKQNWTQVDIANSITLYSASAKGYRLLRKNNFPLPAVRTLQHWAQKIKIKQGILKPVVTMLAETRHMTMEQKLCILSFDDTKLREVFCYDKVSDSTLPPAKNVQVGMLRGLVANWKQPIFYDFDRNMTVDILMDIIKTTKDCGYNIVAVVCDLGGSNRSLLNSINVTPEKPWFSYENQKVYVFADVPHLLKLLRNHFLDEGYLIDGKEVTKDIIYELLSHTSREILSITHKIGPRHLQVSGTERQKVKLAAKLFSHTVAQAVTRAASLGHLDGKNWLECYKLLKTTNDWFDLMNVKVPHTSGRERMQPYGLAILEQNKIIDDMQEMITQMRALNRKSLLPFQRGILQSNNALKLLHADLESRFGIRYILTYRLNQDVLENFFGIIRAKGGMHDHPDQQEFKYRLRSYLLGHNRGILSNSGNVEEDDTPDLGSPSLPLTGIILSNICRNCPSVEEHDEEMDEFQYDAIESVAGYICHRLKDVLPHIIDDQENSYTWVSHLNEGGLCKPTPDFVEKVGQLDRIFKNLNGDTLHVCTGFLKKLIEEAHDVDCDLKAKKLFFRSRMYFTIRKLNENIKNTAYQRQRKINKIIK